MPLPKASRRPECPLPNPWSRLPSHRRLVKWSKAWGAGSKAWEAGSMTWGAGSMTWGAPHGEVEESCGVDAALSVPTAQVRLFGKPMVAGHRRVAIAVARGADVDQARERARTAATPLKISLD